MSEQKVQMVDGFPRRNRIDLLTPAEKAIYDAMQAVESLPPDVRLTEAGCLLQEARGKVADYVEDMEHEQPFNLPNVPEDHNGNCGACHTYPCSCDQINEADEARAAVPTPPASEARG